MSFSVIDVFILFLSFEQWRAIRLMRQTLKIYRDQKLCHIYNWHKSMMLIFLSRWGIFNYSQIDIPLQFFLFIDLYQRYVRIHLCHRAWLVPLRDLVTLDMFICSWTISLLACMWDIADFVRVLIMMIANVRTSLRIHVYLCPPNLGEFFMWKL